MEITLEELLADLRGVESNSGPDDALTMLEWREATGWGEKRLRRSIKLLIGAGAMEAVRVKRESMVGVIQPVHAYRIKNQT